MSIAVESQMNNQVNLQAKPLSSEQILNTHEQQAFWGRVTESEVKTDDNISLAYMYIEHPDSERAIVISSGRIESYLKYKELIFDLYNQGYSIFALDHRGQGLSTRTTANPHHGHIDKFSTYVDDFALFVDTVVTPRQYREVFLVGHSMGGAIGTLYIDKHPNTFTAAVFSAPMYGIKLPISKGFIRWLANLLDTKQGEEPNYILGGKDYHGDEFAKNDLTKSQARYEDYRKLYQQHPELQLGSPTNHWLVESIDAGAKTVKAAKETKTPILILQADEDTVVDNFAQYHGVGGLCELINIPNARHEIFMEQDESRNFAIEKLLKFLASHHTG
ncbi:lysophospholipase [Shewanella psychrophila]|uniref:Lysophospholipase n=1 Tax=Shewanella psychrophila TaxID=225848 RepID=A0A1S6HIK9_9GAMM|nr:alpha/beta fold hydrolase [Shewanella psychrophila]AQS35349.1 lysophospholipase [Shewanella psychrophila]